MSLLESLERRGPVAVISNIMPTEIAKEIAERVNGWDALKLRAESAEKELEAIAEREAGADA